MRTFISYQKVLSESIGYGVVFELITSKYLVESMNDSSQC